MGRPSKNWARFTVKPGQTGTLQPFQQTATDRYTKGKEPKAPSHSPFIIHRVIIHGEPTEGVENIQKAISGAVLILEGSGGKKLELGPAFQYCKECNPWSGDIAYNLEAPVMIPPGDEYNVILSYEKPSKNDADVDLFVVVEGIEDAN